MADDGQELDAEYFREVVTSLEDHPEWILTGDTDAVETAVERAAAGSLGELFYSHESTAGRLHVRMPDRGTPRGVLDAILDQPLDPQLSNAGDAGTFTAALSAAHHAIAEEHATAYVVPKTDPHMVLTVKVPMDYDPALFTTTLDAVGATAETVAQLHSDIRQPIAAYLE